MPSLKEITSSDKFKSLSAEAKAIVIDKVAKDDEAFGKLSEKAQAIVRSKLIGEEVKDESPASYESKPTLASEAGKVAMQGASGLLLDIPKIGDKPIAELFAGHPGSSIDLGMRIRDAVESKDLSKIKQDTLNSKYGFPVPPEPETGVGKVLGIAANLAGNYVSGGAIEKSLRQSFNLKYPKPEQVEEAMKTVENNVKQMVEQNRASFSEAKDRANTTKLFRDIQNNDRISKLELGKRLLADKKAVDVQDRLALKASKELGAKFGLEYEAKAAGKTVSLDDVQEGLGNVLKRSGIIDEAGEKIPGMNISPAQQKVYKMYEAIKSGADKGEMILDDIKIGENRTLPLDKFDRSLKQILVRGKQYGQGDHILTDLRYEFSDKIAELREVGKKFAQDFKARNAIFDTFKPFGKRGETDVKAGIGLFENLAAEDPAQVFPQNRRMMEFLKKYGGEDPSEPIRKLGGEIKGIKLGSAEEDMKTMFSLDEMASKISRSEQDAISRAMDMKDRMGKLLEVSVKKRDIAEKIKKTAIYAGTALGAASLGATATGLVKKVID